MTLADAISALDAVQPLRIVGRVAALRGLTVLAADLPLPVGAQVAIGGRPPRGEGGVAAEVVGFSSDQTILMLLGPAPGIREGDPVTGVSARRVAPVGPGLLGRCVDAMGRPIDARGPLRRAVARPLTPPPIPPLRRRRILEPMHTGVRAIDLMTTLGRGQRVGIFSGPGVGKSTLLGQVARNARADVNVIALIGERGREVGDFIEHSLGPEGLARSVVVAATSDEPPLLRVRAAHLACAAAEFFRDQGRDVMLMMDSVTRFAHAQRQVGLSVGEPPATKGYTPSVFGALAELLERAGALADGPAPPPGGSAGAAGPPAPRAEGGPAGGAAGRRGGSITGLYTILVEGDDLTEPVSDAARGILDGHIVLSRALAQRGHFPAVDVLDSVSRVADAVCDAAHAAARRQVARLLALYRGVEDLVQIGAYARGSSPETDVAIEFRGRIEDLLRQQEREAAPFAAAREALVRLAVESGEALARATRGAGAPARSARPEEARR